MLVACRHKPLIYTSSATHESTTGNLTALINSFMTLSLKAHAPCLRACVPSQTMDSHLHSTAVNVHMFSSAGAKRTR